MITHDRENTDPQPMTLEQSRRLNASCSGEKQQGFTISQMCDTAAWWMQVRGYENVTSRDIYMASPSGELWHVFEMFDHARVFICWHYEGVFLKRTPNWETMLWEEEEIPLHDLEKVLQNPDAAPEQKDPEFRMTMINGIDITGWSEEWIRRLRKATPGLSVPQNTPRGRSERRFLALLKSHADGATFRELCKQTKVPNDSWTIEGYVRSKLFDLRRVGSVTYDPKRRRWSITDRGALVADANAEWVVGDVYSE